MFFHLTGTVLKDSIRFFPELRKRDGIESYVFKIYDSDGSAVYEKQGKGSVPDSISWNGKEIASKGDSSRYKASINVVYVNGNNPEAYTESFASDTEFPVLDIKEEYTVFSPNNDGRKDELPVDSPLFKQ